MSAELDQGRQLAGFRIERLVGRGGMGVVYRAEQVRLGRTVALKVLAPELSTDRSFLDRFERESRLAALIEHPHIIPVYEAGEADGLLFIAMRWVEGSDLGEILRREGPMAVERVLDLLEQVGSALDAAHERGLVHRDVKPANILVAPARSTMKEHAYLTDFGIAKVAASVPFTRTGMFIGTLDYAAPEQFEGRELDGRADVYALGCLLFQCLTGARPFERTQEIAVMYAHLHDPPPRVTEQRSDVPPAFDAIVAKAMAKKREDRYWTCAELIAAARDALQDGVGATVAAPVPAAPTVAEAAPPADRAGGQPGLPPAAPAPSPQPPVAEPPVAPPPPSGPDRTPRRPGRRRLWAALAAALVVAGVVVAVIVVATGGEGGSETTAQGEGATTSSAATQAATTEAAPTAESETEPGSTIQQETSAEAAPVPLSDLEWSAVASPAFEGSEPLEMQRVAGTSDGSVLAVGSQGSARGHDAAFWTLTQPGAEPSAEIEVLAEPGDEVVFGVTTIGDGGAVAVGYRQPEPPRGPLSAAVWLRGDAGWATVQGGLSDAPYEKMNRVAASPGGQIAAVGAAGPGIGENGVPLATDAAAWLSSDAGASWTPAESADFAEDGYQEMRGVVAYGDGFASVGYDGKEAAAWLFDGRSWRRVDSQPDLATGEGRTELDMRAVQQWEGGLVAVGDVRTASGERDGAVWLSPDGNSWTLVGADAFGGPGDQQILGVVTGTFGIVAVGCSGCDTEDATPAVWTSTDGETWTRAAEAQVPSAGTEQMNDVTAAGDTLVTAGWAETGSAKNAAVWAAGPAG